MFILEFFVLNILYNDICYYFNSQYLTMNNILKQIKILIDIVYIYILNLFASFLYNDNNKNPIILPNICLKEGDRNKLYIKKLSTFQNIKIVDVKKIYVEDIDNMPVGVIVKIPTKHAQKFISKLYERNELSSFLGADRLMIHPRSLDPTKINSLTIINYSEFILRFARSLVDNNIEIITKPSRLKINYHGLNIRDLRDCTQKKTRFLNECNYDLTKLDDHNAIMHYDIQPRFCRFIPSLFRPTSLNITFCILRGINGYNKEMGKSIVFPNANYSGNKNDKYGDVIVSPHDDADDFFEILFFISDIAKHSTTNWNIENECVKEQFNKFKNGNYKDNKIYPSRMSVTIRLEYETKYPEHLWKNICNNLK